MLHAIFLGFVVSMIFGHAPVIFPAILGRPLPFRSSFYVHLAVLHASVALRLIGDTSDVLARWRVWGGLLNGIAQLIFLVNSVASIIAGHSPKKGVTSGSLPLDPPLEGM